MRECGELLGFGRTTKRVGEQLNRYKVCLKEGVTYECKGVGGKTAIWDDKAYALFAVELDRRYKIRNCVPYEEIPVYGGLSRTMYVQDVDAKNGGLRRTTKDKLAAEGV